MNKYSGSSKCSCGDCPHIDYSRRANDGTYFCNAKEGWVRTNWVCGKHPEKIREEREHQANKRK